jgi:hypothetical protein
VTAHWYWLTLKMLSVKMYEFLHRDFACEFAADRTAEFAAERTACVYISIYFDRAEYSHAAAVGFRLSK